MMLNITLAKLSQPDGKWYEYATDKVLEAVNAWAFVPDKPIQLTQGTVVEEWISGNGPVSNTLSHFLLLDMDEIEYHNINRNHFDVQNRTFKEVTHHIISPNLPLHLSDKSFIIRHLKGYLQEIMQKPELSELKLNGYLEACLYIAVKEILNTTTHTLLHAAPLFNSNLINGLKLNVMTYIKGKIECRQ